MASVADGIDALEEIATEHPAVANLLRGVIEVHLLPAVAVADDLRAGAARIEVDGTPSQVGPSADELRVWADTIRPAPAEDSASSE